MVVLLNHPVSHRNFFGKNAAARCKKSRSCFRTAWSRLSPAAPPVPSVATDVSGGGSLPAAGTLDSDIISQLRMLTAESMNNGRL